MISSTIKYGVFFLSLLFLGGCQPKVYLMPSPIGLTHESQFFLLSEDNIDEKLLYTLYATNRIPLGQLGDSTGYSIFPSDTLELGFLVYSVGYDGMNWDDLHRESLKQDRDDDLLLTKEYVRPRVAYGKDEDLHRTSAAGEVFFDMIDKALEKSFDKDITVYVHGANSNFYRATAQGAQFFHFTRHNSIILTFFWPSAENIFKYKIDVLHAKKTVPAFARLLEILAIHTNARNINIIGYSAGAQVVAPGLAYLHDLYPALSSKELKERLRIGEVYFAAPDTALKPFVERYLKFRDIVGRTTISMNLNDRILLLATMQNGGSRLGRPDAGELSESEREIVREALDTPDLDVIDAGGSEVLNIGGGHDYWYNNPWVSNDLVMLMIFNESPEERGLIKYYDEAGAALYYFPEDYAETIPFLLKKQKERMKMNILQEKEGK